MKFYFLLSLAFVSLFFIACANTEKKENLKEKRTEDVREKFDPARNPFDDLARAIEIAKAENKRIILDVGGEWCVWCHRIDKFLHSDDEIRSLLEKYYVVVKVNFSKENRNERFLSQYPEIKGYPHFFVLDSDGKFLHSQNTGLLEEGKSYSKKKVTEFLLRWAKTNETTQR